MTLYENGVVSQTALTDPTGHYSFTGVTGGTSNTYTVGITPPVGFTATLPNQGGDPTKDSNLNPATGQSTSFTIAPGATNNDIDLGLKPLPATIGDFVWKDTNGNGVQDSGEPGIPNVVVTLYVNGVVSQTTTTDPTGHYSFTGVTGGTSNTYTVGITPPVGFTATLPNQGGDPTKDSDLNPLTSQSTSFTLAPGVTNNDIDLGLKPLTSTIGDFVWNDLNHNGIQDSGEPGISGLVVSLYLNGVVSQTTTTGPNGGYSFTGVTGGTSNTYTVGVTPPVGFTATLPTQGGDPTKDSDLNPTTNQSTSFTIAPSTTINDIDLGLYSPKATIGDFVWSDTNGNGVQDSGELGIAGVTVQLVDPVSGTVVSTTVTDSGGKYLFTNLNPGSYILKVTAPAGTTFTTPLTGSTLTDSDVTSSTGSVGSTSPFSVTAGQQELTVDAGLKPLPATIGDFVWSDTNGNGVQDSGEPGIPNVVVTLYVNGVVSQTTTTDPTGHYSFTGVTGGTSNTYTVGITHHRASRRPWLIRVETRRRIQI
ncbi:hypothetical protein GO730_04025 [Spirosoma sp. HMF3257]|uniref:SD-repeat containing protein B domain-containing protein n=1 Tax=Spirosoma telluris TaxID=2183553 RepID=A0A327NF28_9BACT|nr:hypothetical protein [Spirosoma telluris]RAI73767.1 hypothetical protein HMF3257_03965 [Spirosoma telluris]